MVSTSPSRAFSRCANVQRLTPRPRSSLFQAMQRTTDSTFRRATAKPLRVSLLGVAALGAALLPAACVGRIGALPSGGAASASGGATGGTASSGGGNGGLSSRGSNPGTVGIHRLNAFEYDNTVNDLLGLSQSLAQTTFIPDETGINGFDNEADALTMT